MRILPIRMLLLSLLISGPMCQSASQSDIPWSLSFEIREAHIPGLHSYAAAQRGDTLLLVGGRKDGLHLRQPSFAFDSLSRNDSIWVYDYAQNTSLGLSIQNLPPAIAAQLSSTNPLYCQRGEYLYIVGGYGYDPTIQDHQTYRSMIAIHVPRTLQHVYRQEPLDTSCYYVIEDEIFGLTGGVMSRYDDHLVIAGGQLFDGVYNPVDNPTFVQVYNSHVIELDIDDQNRSHQIIRDVQDTMLRRRDLSGQVFHDRDGDRLVLYAGVFRPDVNFPYQFIIEYKGGQLTRVPDYRQCLANYHGAHMSVHSSMLNSGYSEAEIHIGGLSPYYRINDELYYDTDVPFTKHISMVMRDDDGQYSEYIHGDTLPYFLGTGTEVFETPILKNSKRRLLGFFLGGIRSPERNVFWSAEDSPSVASSYVVELYAVPRSGGWERFDYANSYYEIDLFPDREYTHFTAHWRQSAEKILLEIETLDGQKLFSQYFETDRPARQQVVLPETLMDYSEFRLHFVGREEYWIQIKNND